MKVQVERFGPKRIHLKTPWRPGLPDRCKKIIGYNWSETNKAWTYPLTLETCRQLRDEFGADLVIGPELWAWAKVEVDREKRVSPMVDRPTLDSLLAVELDQVPTAAPTLWAGLQGRPYQKVVVAFGAATRVALLAPEPGLGKTIESLGALVEAGCTGRVLIIAPKKSTFLVWANEIPKWLCDYKYGYTMTQAVGLSAGRRSQVIKAYDRMSTSTPNDNRLHFLIINLEMARVRSTKICPKGTCDGKQDWCPDKKSHKGKDYPANPELLDIEWDAIVADETHKALINSRGKKASQVGYGFTKLRSAELGMRFALTGTPLKGKKHNLFGTLNWLREDQYTSKWNWIKTYFETAEDGYTVTTNGKLLDHKVEHFYRSLSTIMIRQTKSELRAINPAWVPPDKIFHDVWVKLDDRQLKAYKAMEASGFAEIEGGTLSATGILAEFTRLKQFSGSFGRIEERQRRVDGELEWYNHFIPMMPSAKFEWLMEFLSERGIDERGELSDDVHKVVVASQFTSLINLWAGELRRKGVECHVLTGETKDRDAERIVEDFMKGTKVRVFLINTMAGGVSITLDAADDVVIMDETWVPDDQLQVEDRAHRASNVEHQVDIWYVRSADTIEERIAMLNMDKAESNHVVLDAQRGLAFARTLTGME